MIDVPQKPGLIGLNGQPLVPPKPPEKVTAVKFIRKLGDDLGGIHSARGAAVHRLAGHFISLQEELARVGHLKDLSGDHTPERIEAAAEGIYNVQRDIIGRTTGNIWDAWAVFREHQPDAAEQYRVMALAALGGPCFIPVAGPEDLGAVEGEPVASSAD